MISQALVDEAKRQEKAQSELQEANRVAHQVWIQHPVTQQLIQALTAHKNIYVGSLANNAVTLTEAQLRVYSSALKTTADIITLVQDPFKMLEKIKRQS